jgi:hypothetical protein
MWYIQYIYIYTLYCWMLLDGLFIVASSILLLKYPRVSFKFHNTNYTCFQKMAKDRPTNLPIVGNPQNTPHYDKWFLYYRGKDELYKLCWETEIKKWEIKKYCRKIWESLETKGIRGYLYTLLLVCKLRVDHKHSCVMQKKIIEFGLFP